MNVHISSTFFLLACSSNGVRYDDKDDRDYLCFVVDVVLSISGIDGSFLQWKI